MTHDLGGLNEKQRAERDLRVMRLMQSRMVIDGGHFTASDAAHAVSRSKQKQYLTRDQGKSLCEYLVKLGLLETQSNGRTRHYFKPQPVGVNKPWVRDNGIPLGRYFP